VFTVSKRLGHQCRDTVALLSTSLYRRRWSSRHCSTTISVFTVSKRLGYQCKDTVELLSMCLQYPRGWGNIHWHCYHYVYCIQQAGDQCGCVLKTLCFEHWLPIDAHVRYRIAVLTFKAITTYKLELSGCASVHSYANKETDPVYIGLISSTFFTL